MGNSGWRGLDDTRLDRLFEKPRTFEAELDDGPLGDPSDLSSWISDFEGHHLRLSRIEGVDGPTFALHLDGEPMGELDRLPENWKIAGLL